jgi:eukaryotic-like serine/threonine-protein kinase
MDWIDSRKTLKIEVVLAGDELDRAVTVARESGLAALAEQHLLRKNDAHDLSILMCVLRADVSSATVPFQRLNDYLEAFPELEHHFGKQNLLDLAKTHKDLSDTPAPGVTLAEALRTKRTQAEADSDSGVVELPVNVAKQLGFSKLHCIGRGGYGVVYLARQDAVSGRVVVIKYTKTQSRETAMLSYLQHPNIMPVWSVHEHESYRVFCMPMHGLCTVADILKDIDSRHELPVSGASFLEYSRSRTNDLRSTPASEGTWLPGKLDDDWTAPLNAASVESERLTKLTYIDAVVQRFSRLASALHHVHLRNIIHLDIKPANILVTNDGDFMILDFGLAHHRNYGTLAEACGTARYMAPEQLRQFVYSLPMTPSVSMDLYALGVVFYELLTGKHPFADSMKKGNNREDWINARLAGPTPIRKYNPAIPESVAAIIHKLLAPLPEQRYLTAEDLATDLNRHQENLPLKFAHNPSLRERFRKFRKRHPVFSVALMAGLLAGLAIASFSIAYRKTQEFEQQRIQHQQETAMRQKAEAANQWAKLHRELDSLRMDASSVENPARRTLALNQISAWMTRYGLSSATAAEWRNEHLYTALEPADQTSLELAVVELALLAAHAETLNAITRQGDAHKTCLDSAKTWNDLAGNCLPLVPEVVYRQRDDISARMGNVVFTLPAGTASRSQVDVFCGALLDIANRKLDAARVSLESLVKENPHHMGAQFTLGWVYHTMGAFASASERYQIVSAVMDRDARPVFSRARLLCHMQRNRESREEYTTTLERDPTNAAAYFERANVEYLLKDLRAALNDLEAAEKLGAGNYQVLLLRLQIQQELKQDDEAAATRVEFEQHSPLTAEDFLSRGRSTMTANLPQAIADFRTATDLDQFSNRAWMSLGMALARMPESQDDAIASLKKALELSPSSKEIRAKLGLLLARQGKFKEALKLVDQIEPDYAGQAYTLACVHSLCAEDNEQRQMCVVMLKHARRLGYTKFDQIPNDPDMQNCKRVPEVVKLVKEALAREE